MKTTNRLFLLTILIFWGTLNVYSLDPKKEFRQYIHELWTTDNGLPQGSAKAIKQGIDGYIWIATEEGIVRFDGNRFTVFDRANTPELQVNDYNFILQYRDGTLWFLQTGARGIAKLSNGKFRSYTTTEGWPGTYNGIALDSNGVIWVSSLSGLYHLVGDRFVAMTTNDGLKSDSIGTLQVNSKNEIWISYAGESGRERGVTVLRNGTFTTYDSTNGLFNDWVSSFRESYDGNMWVAHWNGVLNKILKDGKIEMFSAKNGLPANINSILEDSKHRLWISSPTGLDLFENNKITHIPFQKKPNGTSVGRCREDHEGTIWVGTEVGISRVRNGMIESYASSEGIGDIYVEGALEDREGSIWIGIRGVGLFRFRDSKFITISKEEGLSGDLTQSLFEDREGNLWVATANNGLNKIRDGNVTIFNKQNGLSSDFINGGITQDKSGAIWVGTEQGLCKITGTKVTVFTVKDGILNNSISSLFTDSSGVIWISYRGFGIDYYKDGKFNHLAGSQKNVYRGFYYDKNNNLWSAFDSGLIAINLNDLSLKSILISQEIIQRGIYGVVCDENGAIWFGTVGGGLNRYRDGKTVQITPKDGLYDFNIFYLLEDQFGNFWMDCNKGIYRVSKKDANDFADGKIKSIQCVAYGTADGMKNRECNGTAFPGGWKRQDGTLCFPTVRGVAMIDPSDIKLNMTPPSVVIEQVVANHQNLDPTIANILSPGTDKFEFHFTGISFIGADKVKYKYKLTPYESEWVDAGTRRDAYYTNIPPGDYRFSVIAANNDGIWNETGASTSFTLMPHFYETNMFYAFIIIGFVGFGPGIYFLRVRQLKNREKELQDIVEARTAELRSEKNNVEKALDNLKEAQNKLVLSEKMASLGQLTAGIAHEIKNPLNFVTNFATLSNDLMTELKDELEKNKEKLSAESITNIEDIIKDLQQNVGKINEHGKRADSIVRGMLLHSRGRSGERQMTDINALLAEYANLAYHGLRAQDTSFNIKIETNFDDSLGKVNIVPQDLSRVFLNIINNGCYSANDKKKQVGGNFAPVITVSSKNLGNTFEVRIRDNGNGIPQRVLDKIFNPFFTTKPAGAGTGLGLSLSYDIITQEHKGEIIVNTKEGEYAEFVITIPKEIA